MRAVFGVVSLLVVLAVVGWTAGAAWRGSGGGAAPPVSHAASTAVAPLPQQVGRDVDAALRQGQVRNDDAERRDAASADQADRAGAAGSAP